MKASRHVKLMATMVGIALCCGFAVGNDADAAKKKNKGMSKVLASAESKMGGGFISIGNGYGQGQVAPADDKTLAPFFYQADGDPETDQLPLKKTSADVKIAGVIASVRISQVFENDGDKPIEAIYVFPASTRAAVHAMRMKIGERTVEAKIEEREEAKQQYEAAKSAGKKASLLEQERPNVFTMSVANIMPGDKIEVQLDYSELLIPTDSVYEFVYPTVVGPRYGGGADPVKDKWISNPYLGEGEPEPYEFDIEMELESGIAIKELTSPSHEVDVEFKSDKLAKIRLDQKNGGNKDFIIRYRLAGSKIESGILTYDHGDESFFVMMMEPPEKPKKSQIPPREYIFVVDVSGSMHGFPLDTSKSLMKKLLKDMDKGDFFNVVLFAGASYKMSNKSMPATSANIKKAMNVIDNQKGGGGTELMDGLRTAYDIPEVEKTGVSRTVVVVTDGYVGVEAQAFKYIRNNLDDANLFAFGIGSSVNRALIEGMAKAGLGEPFVVLNPEVAPDEAKTFREYIEAPVLTDIEVEFDGFKGSDVLPEKVPDLLAKRPIVLIGKFNGKKKGEIVVKGVTGGGKFKKSMKVKDASSSDRTEPLRHLWARNWVELLEDQTAMLPGDPELKEAITALGLEYTLLTSQTSFVAIDSEVTNETGNVETIKQPLPLPEGVSNYAVGSVSTSSPGYYANAPMGGAMPSLPYKAKKGGTKYAMTESAADKDAEDDLLGVEKQEKPKVGKTSLTLTYGTDPAGSKIKIHKRKKIEWIIDGVLEKNVDAGKLSCAKTHSIKIVLSIDEDGKVESVKVTGTSSKVAKALEKKLEVLSGLGSVDSITVSAVFTCS